MLHVSSNKLVHEECKFTPAIEICTDHLDLTIAVHDFCLFSSRCLCSFSESLLLLQCSKGLNLFWEVLVSVANGSWEWVWENKMVKKIEKQVTT